MDGGELIYYYRVIMQIEANFVFWATPPGSSGFNI